MLPSNYSAILKERKIQKKNQKNKNKKKNKFKTIIMEANRFRRTCKINKV